MLGGAVSQATGPSQPGHFQGSRTVLKGSRRDIIKRLKKTKKEKEREKEPSFIQGLLWTLLLIQFFS